MAWAGLTDTLTGTADNINITTTGLKFNFYIYHVLSTGGVGDTRIRFNSDSGSNYTHRRSFNGGTDSSATSETSVYDSGFTSREWLGVSYVIGISAEEKLIIRYGIDREATGAGTAPGRLEVAAKWVNTSDSITTGSLVNTQAGDYNTDSNLSIFETD